MKLDVTATRILSTPPPWFRLEKYEAFAWQDGFPHEDLLKLWGNALFFRQYLYGQIRDGRADEVREFIDRLAADPTDSCGFSLRWSGNVTRQDVGEVAHPYSQGTTWATRGGDLFFVESLEPLQQLGEFQCLDDAYFSVASQYGPKAFLTVNLLASDVRIRADFSRWLTAIRRERNLMPPTKEGPEELVKKWLMYKLLPFLDLVYVWAPANTVKVKKIDAGRWLRLGKRSSTLREFVEGTLSRAAELALNPAIPRYLAISRRL